MYLLIFRKNKSDILSISTVFTVETIIEKEKLLKSPHVESTLDA
jgi:hypothetical protein